jgi:hypothetical protein
MLVHTLLLKLCERHFSTVLVHYFVVGMKQEESDHPLSVKLAPLVHTLSPVSQTTQNTLTTSISYLMYLKADDLT